MSTAADGAPLEQPRGRRARPEHVDRREHVPDPEPGADATPAELEADIARTRRELGDTVGALADKLNPKVQAEHQAGHLKEQAGHLKEQAAHQVEHLKERAGRQVERARHGAQSAVDRLRGSEVGDEGDRAAIAEGMARAHGADEVPSTRGAAGVPGAPAGAVVPDPGAAAVRTDPEAEATAPEAVVPVAGTRPGGTPWVAVSIGAAVFAGIGALITTRMR